MNTMPFLKKEIFSKYPCDEANKILTRLIRTLLQIRKHPRYQEECIIAVNGVAESLKKAAYRAMYPIYQQFDILIFQLSFIVLTFPILSDRGAKKVEKYCMSIFPDQVGIFELFLGKKLEIEAQIKFNEVLSELKEETLIQYARLEVVSGRYDEFFMYYPGKTLSNAEIISLIKEYFKLLGFVAISHLSFESIKAVNEEGTICIYFINRPGLLTVVVDQEKY